MLCARSGRMRRTGAFRMGPGTVERLPLRRPRAVPERCGLPPMHAFVNHFSAHRSDLVDKSVHERKCGTGSRKERDGDAARGGLPRGNTPGPLPGPQPHQPGEHPPRSGGGGPGGGGGFRRLTPPGFPPPQPPPRSRVPRADGEAAGACRIGRGGNLGPPGKSARAGIVRQRGIRNSDFAAHRLPNSCARRRLEAQAPCPERNRSHLSNSDKACIRPRS